MKFEIIFKRGPVVVAKIEGFREVDADAVTVHEVAEKTIVCEQFLERLLGLRVHIQQMP